MINYQLSFLIAVSAFVYSSLLTEPGMILNWLYKKLDKTFNTDKRACNGKGPHPVFMFLIHCSKCVSGQWSFWIYIYIYHNVYLLDPVKSFLLHVFFVSFTIFLTEIIRIIYKHINQDE